MNNPFFHTSHQHQPRPVDKADAYLQKRFFLVDTNLWQHELQGLHKQQTPRLFHHPAQRQP